MDSLVVLMGTRAVDEGVLTVDIDSLTVDMPVLCEVMSESVGS